MYIFTQCVSGICQRLLEGLREGSAECHTGYQDSPFLLSLFRHSPLITDIIHSGETFRLSKKTVKEQRRVGICERCGYISSQKYCKACVLLEGLNKGLPRIAVGGRSDVSEFMESGGHAQPDKGEKEKEKGADTASSGEAQASEKRLDSEEMGKKLKEELNKVFDI